MLTNSTELGLECQTVCKTEEGRIWREEGSYSSRKELIGDNDTARIIRIITT
jgi:hypothetical protein